MSLEKQLRYNAASKGKRLLTVLIDILFFYILLFVIAFLFALILNVFTPGLYADFVFNNKVGLYILIYIIYILYYTLSEYVTGKTLGKLITGTKIVDIEGNKPSFKMALIRTLCRFIPFDAFSYIFGDDERGWHDKIAKSYVIDAKYIV
jgi:uncharacterized RDD family membrane protein YckC